MKKITVLLGVIIMLVSSTLIAQEESSSNENPVRKGRLFLGTSTNAGINFSKSSIEFDGMEFDRSTGNNFNINGSLGYTFLDNFVVGIQVGVSTSKVELEQTNGEFDSENKSTSLSAGPFMVYYFDFGNNSIRPYATGNAQFGRTKSNSQSLVFTGNFDSLIQDFDSKSNRFQWRVGVGVAFFLNDHISLNTEIGYNYLINTDVDQDFKSKVSNIGLNAGLSIFL